MQNPLEVLGVPKALVARERGQGDLSKVLALANDYYRALAKQYSPDLPGGDAALMREFTEAIDELRDPDGLTVSADFYVGTEDANRLVRGEERQARVAFDADRLHAVVNALSSVDQFSLFGVDAPTSIIAGLGLEGLQRGAEVAHGTVVFEVQTHDALVMYQSYHPEEANTPIPLSGPLHYERAENRWYDAYLALRQSRRQTRTVQHRHADLRHQPGVKAVGGATRSGLLRALETIRGNSRSVDTFVLDSIALGQMPVDWAVADHAWWLSAIEPSVHEDDYVILMATGEHLDEPVFALAGPIRASASM